MLALGTSALLTLPSSVFADPCVKAASVKTPCEGVLLPVSEANKALKCLEVELPGCRVQLEKDHAILRADKQLYVDLYNAATLENEKLHKLLDTALRPVPVVEKPWYDNNWMWFGIGILVGGTGTTVAIIKTK